MQLNKIMKGVFIALPVVTLMACSSSPDNSQAEAERRAAEQQAASAAAADNTSDVEMASVEREPTPEERNAAKKVELMQNQTILFDFDRSSVNSDFYAMLREHADYLIKNPGQRIRIEGHCDKRGTPEYNIALGERRAKSVETFLQNAGVSRSQISVVSYGEEKPVAMGDSESAFRQNRRAEIVYQ